MLVPVRVRPSAPFLRPANFAGFRFLGLELTKQGRVPIMPRETGATLPIHCRE